MHILSSYVKNKNYEIPTSEYLNLIRYSKLWLSIAIIINGE